MPVTPWKTCELPLPGTSYVALISYLPLKHFRAIPKFFRFTYEIMSQLRSSPGLIGNGTTFSSSRRDGPDQVRVFGYEPRCQCLRYRGGISRVPS